MTATANPLIRIAHSPDADDAFMFYAMAKGLIDTEGLHFEHVLCDIETLNQEAHQGTYEISALSYYGYATVAERYAILPVGSSVGDKYGPVLVANTPLTKEAIVAGNLRLAIPGTLTSAYLFLKLWLPEANVVPMAFDAIGPAVKAGEVDAGLIIHEGQVTYVEEGFHKVVDLGEWWFEHTNLLLPLGCNGVRKDLGEAMIQKLGRVLHRSVSWALANKEEALAGCAHYGRGLNPVQLDRFVGMYVNGLTLDANPELRKAVRLMLSMAHGAGLLPQAVVPEFVELPSVCSQA